MRGREKEAVILFNKAFAADPKNAVRCLFYLRDVRGGQGERSVFAAILDELSDEMVGKIAKYIPEYGRWDEVPINEKTQGFMLEQFLADEAAMAKGESVSLLAKWLPSENTSSKTSFKNAQKLADFWGMKPQNYRKRVTALRKYIQLLEQKMSAKDWENIDFSKLPSQAHKKHIKAFMRHQEERYREYLEKLKSGDKSVKINSGTLYTYQIYDMVKGWDVDKTKIDAANEFWKALPDYTRGAPALVVADVSGSMEGLHWGGVKREIEPMSISVSLALYFAERNKGPFQNYFMTFSDDSRLQKVNGSTLKEKMDSIESADWGGSTNLQSAFDSILKAAIAANAKADEVPRILYIISDMEFNVATRGNDKTNFEVAEQKFKENGYELPHLVFWNVDARQKQAPATKYDNRVTLISGSSQSTFRYAIEGKTPVEAMLDILNSDRYSSIDF